MDKSHILEFLLVIEIVVLLGNAVAISRDYQDSWVLEGLEIPFTVFMITYVTVFLFEKNAKRMVLLAVICNLTLMLIPNLKYGFFLGTSVDQHVQYGLAQYVYDEGHLATQVFAQSRAYQYYVNTPLMHLSFAIFSIFTEIPVSYSFKYLPVFWSILFPLIMYTIIKNLKLTKKQVLLKYALLFSFIPITSEFSYVVVGGTFAMLLVSLILSQLVRLLQKNDRRHLVLFFFFGFALVLTHSFSSIQLILLISMVVFVLKFFHRETKSYRGSLLVILLMNLTWYLYVAIEPLEQNVRTLVNSLFTVPTTGFVPPRFFELAGVNVFESLKTILVYHGADMFVGFLIIVSLVSVAKMKMHSKELKFLSLFIVSTYLFLMVSVVLHVGAFYYRRMVNWPLIISPIFVSIFLFRMNNKRRCVAHGLKCIVVFLIIVLTTIELFQCQPIISSANVLSENLPADEPLVYVGSVNSVYQRQMINYAERYVRGRIACDKVTRNQIYGLTGYNFSQRFIVWYYPFSRILDENITEQEYDYFLIHLPGKSGAFEEHAEIRTRSLILGALNNSTYNIAYSNGESYVLAKSLLD